jgi:hypothetical protein
VYNHSWYPCGVQTLPAMAHVGQSSNSIELIE